MEIIERNKQRKTRRRLLRLPVNPRYQTCHFLRLTFTNWRKEIAMSSSSIGWAGEIFLLVVGKTSQDQPVVTQITYPVHGSEGDVPRSDLIRCRPSIPITSGHLLQFRCLILTWRNVLIWSVSAVSWFSSALLQTSRLSFKTLQNR